jgi:hypothetical protein
MVSSPSKRDGHRPRAQDGCKMDVSIRRIIRRSLRSSRRTLRLYIHDHVTTQQQRTSPMPQTETFNCVVRRSSGRRGQHTCMQQGLWGAIEPQYMSSANHLQLARNRRYRRTFPSYVQLFPHMHHVDNFSTTELEIFTRTSRPNTLLTFIDIPVLCDLSKNLHTS